MGSVHRLCWALARKRSPSRFGRARPKRFVFLRRYFGFLALAALIIGASALAPSHDTSTPPPAASAPRAVAATYIRVIDGDTLHVDGKKIRLTGIDAPELSQTCRDAQAREWPCGQAAKARLIELVSRGEVACSARGRDRYGRTLARWCARAMRWITDATPARSSPPSARRAPPAAASGRADSRTRRTGGGAIRAQGSASP